MFICVHPFALLRVFSMIFIYFAHSLNAQTESPVQSTLLSSGISIIFSTRGTTSLVHDFLILKKKPILLD